VANDEPEVEQEAAVDSFEFDDRVEARKHAVELLDERSPGTLGQAFETSGREGIV